MAEHQVDATWMWHPHFVESDEESAGTFVHFRKDFVIESTEEIPTSLQLTITADTRYKLYVNCKLVTFGPVKGDANLWFYDEVDIATYLRVGRNQVRVHVLRYFYSTSHATSFPRLPSGGLRIQPAGHVHPLQEEVQSSTSWETAIDLSVKLRIDEPEDDFLHIYEHRAISRHHDLQWISAKLLQFQASTGQSAPWILSPRMIPTQMMQETKLSSLHNLRSCVASAVWSAALLSPGTKHQVDDPGTGSSPPALIALPANSKHQVDLEVDHHMTAFVELCFRQSKGNASTVSLTYAESYESPPSLVPYLRHKTHRQDYSKDLYGPRDIYELGADNNASGLCARSAEDGVDIIRPFHFRTFRFIRLQIEVGDSELVVEQFALKETHYPLDVIARIATQSDNETKPLWETSIRTLQNCMHDCYEDCPFYEQLQYAMDTRSSILFTYHASGDDRPARQAIIQLRNSFVPRLGLTASRSPSHRLQIIPHFSLYWVSMVCDHWLFNGDSKFAAQFLSTIDAILNYFDSRLEPSRNLVKYDDMPGVWHFHDWTEEWRPYGIPASAVASGISTYTNCLYAYTLDNAATLLESKGRPSLASEYYKRANLVKSAVRAHCFDGQYFTDSLVEVKSQGSQHSQLNQAWAVLCGAAKGNLAVRIVRDSLDNKAGQFIASSISMSFYVLRALSLADKTVYNEQYHRFWTPWRAQLALGLTTWEEDQVSQRSDCHAWGSAPIYELLSEVAGIRPLKPGWAVIGFEPRLEVYRDFEATVPLPLREGCVQGLIRVAWAPIAGNDVKVLLSVTAPDKTILVQVKLPSQAMQTVESGKDYVFLAQTKDLVSFAPP